MAQYIEAGKKFNYTATGNVAYHAVVIAGDLIGVATKAGVSGDVIACDAEGVFAIEKAEEAITQGSKVYLNSSGKITATASTNTYAGIAWEAAAEADATCLVKIN